MLNFALKPDASFKNVLNNSFLTLIDVITQNKDPETLEGLLPNAIAIYSLETALKTLETLKDLNNRVDCWELNDFHLVLIYDALDYYCYGINEIDQEWVRSYASNKGVVRIDFNDLVNKYFPQPDFEYFKETFDQKNINFREEINPAVWKIVNRLRPTQEELEPKLIIKSSNVNKGRLKKYSSESKVFSDSLLS